jgi:methyltransferase OMS1
MARVCTPGGRLLFIEHGRSDRPWLARFQDRHEHRHAKALGCHWNRDPLEIVRAAGVTIETARRSTLGVLYVIEATRAM